VVAPRLEPQAAGDRRPVHATFGYARPDDAPSRHREEPRLTRLSEQQPDLGPAAGAPARAVERLSPLELRAWRGFLWTHAAVIRQLDAELRDHHQLSLTSYEVLLYLYQAPGRRLRMSELADSVLLSLSGITRLVDRLARAGLVVREPCLDDRRGFFTVLTDEGKARFRDAARTHLAGIRAHFLVAYDEADLETLAALWTRIPLGRDRPGHPAAWDPATGQPPAPVSREASGPPPG
jgi:DNA-binding MarR family transcriptional regulator